MTPIQVAQGWGSSLADEVEGVNIVDVNPRHGLWSFGLDGGGGVVEFWDPRSRTALTRLNLPGSTLLPAQSLDDVLAPAQKLSVTAMASHPTDGLSMAIGTNTGHTLLYDLRSPTPFAVKDQGYGEEIRTVDWLRGGGAQEDGGRVVSADSKVIKVWSKEDVGALSRLELTSSPARTSFPYTRRTHSSTFTPYRTLVSSSPHATRPTCRLTTSPRSGRPLVGQVSSIRLRRSWRTTQPQVPARAPMQTSNSSTRMSSKRPSCTSS